MKTAFIGIGNVGFALADNLQKKGYIITIAHNNPNSGSVKSALDKNPAFTVKNVQDAVDEADVIFLATPFFSTESVLIEELGFLSKDTGDLSMALHLEHMTLLWVKMVRRNGHNPRFVWAYLEK
jgi:predicted dinucleotide-binding enzyme